MRLGIKDGEHLYWKEDPQVFATVASERKVIYDGDVPNRRHKQNKGAFLRHTADSLLDV